MEGRLLISRETIYRHIRRDRRDGGELFRFLRQSSKWRKRHPGAERRGRLTGKRHISERPAAIETREEIGHWEMDTIVSAIDRYCVVSLVERATGCLLLGKLRSRSVADTNRRVLQLIRANRHLAPGAEVVARANLEVARIFVRDACSASILLTQLGPAAAACLCQPPDNSQACLVR